MTVIRRRHASSTSTTSFDMLFMPFRRAMGTPSIVMALAVLLVTAPAYADDSAGNAPKNLTLDQPTDTPTDRCMPIKDSGTDTAPIKLHQTFVDNFDKPALSTSTWETHFPGPSNVPNNRTLPDNTEKEIYVDPAFMGAGINPFSIKNGVLSIVMQKTPPEYLDKFARLPYTSGLITTRHSFEQTYGYFEIRARMPRGRALWPAFWMLRTKQSWPPEIDIFEVLVGDKPESIYMTTHWKEEGIGKPIHSGCRLKVDGSDKNFHLYGALWGKKRIVYYIDRKPVAQLNTPPGLDHPMYLLANLAMQKIVDATTPVPASFDIDWIAAYDF